MNLFNGQGPGFLSNLYDNVCATISGKPAEPEPSHVPGRDTTGASRRTTRSATLHSKPMSVARDSAKSNKRVVDQFLEGTFDDGIVVRLSLSFCHLCHLG